MSRPFVSFIVPVLNAAPFLGGCLESLIHDDAEIIIIDDGSTDGSAEIAARFAASNQGVKFLHGKRQGAGAARNCGLDVARGEYVVFVDADDWIEPDLVSEIKDNRGRDIIFFGYREVRHDAEKVCRIEPSGDFSNDIDSTLARLFRSPERFFGFTWNKAFRREIIEAENIRFNPDLIIKEDEEFCLRFVNHIRSLFIIGDTPYNYRILATSLSHRKLRDRRLTLLAETIEQTAMASPWPLLGRAVLQAVHEYHLDGFAETEGATFDRWQQYVDRNGALVPDSLARKLFAIPFVPLRKFVLRMVYVNPFVRNFKSLLQKLKK